MGLNVLMCQADIIIRDRHLFESVSARISNRSVGGHHESCDDVDDDMELNVLGCRVDILGTNCDQCVCMVQCCFTSTETIRLIRTGSPGRPPRLLHSP